MRRLSLMPMLWKVAALDVVEVEFSALELHAVKSDVSESNVLKIVDPAKTSRLLTRCWGVRCCEALRCGVVMCRLSLLSSTLWIPLPWSSMWLDIKNTKENGRSVVVKVSGARYRLASAAHWVDYATT